MTNLMTSIRLEKAATDNGFDLLGGKRGETMKFSSCHKPQLGTVTLSSQNGLSVEHRGCTYRCDSHQMVWNTLRSIYLAD